MKTAISDMERLERAQYKHYEELGIDSYDSFLDSNFDWACDSCLRSNAAIRANPKAQHYCWNPHFAYFDSRYSCNTCGKEFTFGKEEKRFWFEQLQFWTDSSPNHCVDCRKEIRHLKTQNSILSEMLKKEEENLSIAKVQQVIDMYLQWGKAEKATYYQSLLRKKQRNSTQA